MHNRDLMLKGLRGESNHCDSTISLTEDGMCERLFSYAHCYKIVSSATGTSIELPPLTDAPGMPIMLTASDITAAVAIKDIETGSTIATLAATQDYVYLVSTGFEWVSITTT